VVFVTRAAFVALLLATALLLGYRVPRHFHPMGVRHYWVARGPTVVALTFDGPYTLTYVNAYEAPKGTSFPRQY
jgi:hypothetical protein